MKCEEKRRLRELRGRISIWVGTALHSHSLSPSALCPDSHPTVSQSQSHPIHPSTLSLYLSPPPCPALASLCCITLRRCAALYCTALQLCNCKCNCNCSCTARSGVAYQPARERRGGVGNWVVTGQNGGTKPRRLGEPRGTHPRAAGRHRQLGGGWHALGVRGLRH